MEIKVEGLDNSLPPKCYVGIRSGGVLKQARYDPDTIYRFTEAKRFGKIEIYQRIGTCDVAWNCEESETRVCKALDTGKSDTGIRMRVSMSRTSLHSKGDGPPQKAEKAQATQKNVKADSAAKSAKYLAEHGVEDMLTAAMRALLKQLPDDPSSFLCNFIATSYGSQSTRGEGAPIGDGFSETPKAPIGEYVILRGAAANADTPAVPEERSASNMPNAAAPQASGDASQSLRSEDTSKARHPTNTPASAQPAVPSNDRSTKTLVNISPDSDAIDDLRINFRAGLVAASEKGTLQALLAHLHEEAPAAPSAPAVASTTAPKAEPKPTAEKAKAAPATETAAAKAPPPGLCAEIPLPAASGGASVARALLQAASGIDAGKPVVAAGLAMAAAHTVMNMPESVLSPSRRRCLQGLVQLAVEAAKAGSSTAASLNSAVIAEVEDAMASKPGASASVVNGLLQAAAAVDNSVAASGLAVAAADLVLAMPEAVLPPWRRQCLKGLMRIAHEAAKTGSSAATGLRDAVIVEVEDAVRHI